MKIIAKFIIVFLLTSCFSNAEIRDDERDLILSALNTLTSTNEQIKVEVAKNDETTALYSSADLKLALQCIQKIRSEAPLIKFHLIKGRVKGPTMNYDFKQKKIVPVQGNSGKGITNLVKLYYSASGDIREISIRFCEYVFGFEVIKKNQLQFLGCFEEMML